MRWEANSPASPLLQPGAAGLRQQQAHAVRPRGECCGQRRDEVLDPVTDVDVEGRCKGTRTETRLYLQLLYFRWPEHRVGTRVGKAGAQESVGTCHLSPRQRAPSHGTPEPYPGAGFHSHPLGLVRLLPPAAAAGKSPQQEAPAKAAGTSDGHKWRDRATEGKSSS